MTCRPSLDCLRNANTKLYFFLISLKNYYLSLELLVQKYCIITTTPLLFWCPYIVIKVSVQCNGGLLHDIVLLTLCDSIGEPFSPFWYYRSDNGYFSSS